MKAQIFILDDEECIRALLRKVLEHAGYACHDTESDEEAIKILGTTKIDLLIQDLLRDFGDGCEFVRLLKSDPRFKYIPILMLAGFPKEQAEARFAQHQVDFGGLGGYLAKPCQPQELLAKVKEILNRTATAESKPDSGPS